MQQPHYTGFSEQLQGQLDPEDRTPNRFCLQTASSLALPRDPLYDGWEGEARCSGARATAGFSRNFFLVR